MDAGLFPFHPHVFSPPPKCVEHYYCDLELATEEQTWFNDERVQRYHFGVLPYDRFMATLNDTFGASRTTESFQDSFYDREAMKRNQWTKKRTFIHSNKNSTRDVWISKTEVKVDKEDQSLTYSQEISEDEPKDLNHADVVVTMTVDRQTYEHPGQGWILRVDQTKFADQDPYCVCSLELKRGRLFPKDKFNVVKEFCHQPARSKIMEYIFRYESNLYWHFRDNGLVLPDLHFQGVTPQQWEEVLKNGNAGKIMTRMDSPDSLNHKSDHVPTAQDFELLDMD